MKSGFLLGFGQLNFKFAFSKSFDLPTKASPTAASMWIQAHTGLYTSPKRNRKRDPMTHGFTSESPANSHGFTSYGHHTDNGLGSAETAITIQVMPCDIATIRDA